MHILSRRSPHLVPTKVSGQHIAGAVKLKLKACTRSKENDCTGSNSLGYVVTPVGLEALEDGRRRRRGSRVGTGFGVHVDDYGGGGDCGAGCDKVGGRRWATRGEGGQGNDACVVVIGARERG